VELLTWLLEPELGLNGFVLAPRVWLNRALGRVIAEGGNLGLKAWRGGRLAGVRTERLSAASDGLSAIVNDGYGVGWRW
jgi:hypothetical protein